MARWLSLLKMRKYWRDSEKMKLIFFPSYLRINNEEKEHPELIEEAFNEIRKKWIDEEK